jgi:hypothetical protein
MNPVPEKRVGLALLLIGGFALLMYVANTSISGKADPATFLFLLVLVLLGWGLRERFKNWGAPPPAPKPPPKAAGGGGAKPGGFSLPGAKKAAPPPPPKPPIPTQAPAPKPKGMLGAMDNYFKPKNKK